jgi:hypothetical protein
MRDLNPGSSVLEWGVGRNATPPQGYTAKHITYVLLSDCPDWANFRPIGYCLLSAFT